MQAKKPVTLSDILAVVDPAARHATLWGSKSVAMRGVTVREFVRLLPEHPTLTLIMDPEKTPSDIDDIIGTLGLPAMAAFAAVGSDIPAAKMLRLGAIAVADAFLSVSALTFVFRDVGDFFVVVRNPQTPSPAPSVPTPTEEDVSKDTRLMATVRDAVEYSARTGIDGLDLTPIALEFRMRTLAEVDRGDRLSLMSAVAAAMGDEKQFEIARSV